MAKARRVLVPARRKRTVRATRRKRIVRVTRATRRKTARHGETENSERKPIEGTTL